MTAGSYGEFFLQAQERYWDQFIQLLGAPALDNAVYVILASVAALHALERLAPARPARSWRSRTLRLDVFYTLFNYVLFWWAFGYALGDVCAEAVDDLWRAASGGAAGMLVDLSGLPVWLQIVALFLLWDLAGYAGHRALHRFDLLWQFHKVHHVARELDVWNAARSHPVENLFYAALLYIPLRTIGVSVEYSIGAVFVYHLLSNFSHANLQLPLGPLRYLINHPQMHIWHHERTIAGRQAANYGAALVIWDYLLRTAYRPTGETVGALGFEGMEHFPHGFLRETIQPFLEVVGRPSDYESASAAAAARRAQA